MPVNRMPEILAHEVAHLVTIGLECDEHGPIWKEAYDKIAKEYERIARRA
jgi:flavorubredoxin